MKKFLKRFFSVLTCVEMLYNAFSLNLNTFAVDSQFILGDVNSDNVVDAIDASAVLVYYAQIQTGIEKDKINAIASSVADMNEDNNIDAVDASLILSVYIANQISVRTEFNGHQYAICDMSFTWSEAEKFCEMLGGHLVVITSDEEQKFVESFLEKGTRNSYWLGGLVNSKDDIDWVTGEETSYTNWAYNQPDNYHSNENALMMYKTINPMNKRGSGFGTWNDLKDDGTCGSEEFFGIDNIGLFCEWE